MRDSMGRRRRACIVLWRADAAKKVDAWDAAGFAACEVVIKPIMSTVAINSSSTWRDPVTHPGGLDVALEFGPESVHDLVPVVGPNLETLLSIVTDEEMPKRLGVLFHKEIQMRAAAPCFDCRPNGTGRRWIETTAAVK